MKRYKDTLFIFSLLTTQLCALFLLGIGQARAESVIYFQNDNFGDCAVAYVEMPNRQLNFTVGEPEMTLSINEVYIYGAFATDTAGYTFGIDIERNLGYGYGTLYHTVEASETGFSALHWIRFYNETGIDIAPGGTFDLTPTYYNYSQICGTFSNSYGGGTSYADAGVLADVAFKIGKYYPSAGDYIQINTPFEGQLMATGTDFDIFGQYKSDIDIQIKYNFNNLTLDNNWYIYGAGNLPDGYYASTTGLTYRSISDTDITDLPQGLYTLSATGYNNIGEVVLQSDDINFEINAGKVAGQTASTSYAVQCDGYGVIGNALCAVFNYLIVPSTASLSQFYDLRAMVENKVPFGYPALFTAQLQSLSASGTPAYTLTIPQTLKDNIFTPLKTGFACIVWILFLFWGLHRLRSLDL